MTEYGTIKIPRDEYERHNQRREELGLTWQEYINGEAPEISNTTEIDYERLGNELEEIANSASMAGDPGANGNDISREICNRIDDLETELKTVLERSR